MIVFQEDSSSGYRERTIANASADATIAIALDFKTAGEKLTKEAVKNQGKVYIPIDGHDLTVNQERVDKIVKKLNSIKTKSDSISLNIAGNGIYTMKGFYKQKEVDDFTYELLKAVVSSPDLKNKIGFIRSGGQTGFDEAGAKAGEMLNIPTLVYAPKGWRFRTLEADISDEKLFKLRFDRSINYETFFK